MPKAISVYAEINLLLFVVWFSLKNAVRLIESSSLKVQWGHWLKVGYFLFLLAVTLPVLALWLPKKVLLDPPTQVLSEIGIGSSSPILSTIKKPKKEISFSSPEISMLRALGYGLLAGTLLGIIFYLGRLLHQQISWSRILEEEPLVKEIGRVRVVASNRTTVPYSVRANRKAYVVVPMHLLGERRDLLLSVHHEIQHHRQRDTVWAGWLESVRALCWVNPAAGWLVDLMGELQEFACDEAVLCRKAITPKEYGLCLIRAAESALGFRVPRASTRMVRGPAGSTLNRRIAKMGNRGSQWLGQGFTGLFFLGGLLGLMSCAYLSTSAVSGKKLSREEADKYAQKAAEGGTIPIVMNDRVFEVLNRYVGTQEGRDRVRKGLDRMPAYRPMIERKIAEYGLPKELLAIPLLESNFKNGAESSMKARGIWQFIPGTARRYHLTVNEKVDERLDAEKETDAAMQYFRDLNEYFKDWQLAIKAYNEGEKHVDDLIKQYGTRDAWTIEKAESRENYLGGAVASMILLKSPELVN
jgi:membrane-bound lytic murein transglycosylase D